MTGATPAPARLAEGAILGGYTIVRHLATGGMAEIYLARAPSVTGLEKRVVLKRMIPKLAGERDYLEMFLDEARIALTFQHPNLAEVFEVGMVDGVYFMVMEFLDGRDLRSIRRWLPLEQSLAVILGLCGALHYAHEKTDSDGRALQIVHRDVSPQNVIVTFEGAVKLLDFGIASATLRIGETRGGVIKGKLAYMSPEQCRGELLDRRSDLFSVGIMLWELTVHARLFEAANDYDLLKKIVEGRIPRPSEIDPSYPPLLERVVMRALEKDRARRYQTAFELRMDLEALARAMRLNLSSSSLQRFMESVREPRLRSVTPTPTPSTRLAPAEGEAPPRIAPARYRWRRWAAAIAVVLLATGGMVLRYRRPADGKKFATNFLPAPAPPATVERPDPIAPPAVAPAIAVPPMVGDEHDLPSLPSRHRAAAPENLPPRAVAKRVRRMSGAGTLVLATSPWCEVTVDGIARGPTPLTLPLDAGAHDVRLSNGEWKIHRALPVVVRPGETLRKKLVFPR